MDGYFSDIQFWGSHDSTINAVLEGRADVGAGKNTIWELLSRENPRIEAELEILATSPKVPSNGLLTSPTIDAGTREKIREILLALRTEPESAEVLRRLRAKGFVPMDRESYGPVFDVAEQAGIDLTSYAYENQ